MTLAEATRRFRDYARQNDSTVDPQIQLAIHNQAPLLLTNYFSPDAALTAITPSGLRDFLSRWYVEKACAQKPNVSNDAHSSLRRIPQSLNARATELDEVPEPQDLLVSLADFFKWA